MKHTQRRRGKGTIVLGIVLGVLFVYLGVQWILCRNAVNEAYTRLESYKAQSITLSYGNMTYVDEGEGEVILVAHGISGGYDQAFDTVKERADDYRIIAPSRFGYLDSDAPEQATPEEQAKAYAELLDHLGIEKVYVLGTSAGGTVAIRFALDFPERTAGLILYSSAAPLVEEPESYSEYQGPPAFLCNNFGMWLIKPLFEPIMGMDSDTIYGMLPMNERREGMIIDASITNPDMARNYNEYPIESLQMPTLIIHAKDDKLSDYSAMEAAADRFPNSTFIALENGGHLMSEHNEEIDTALSEFIND